MAGGHRSEKNKAEYGETLNYHGEIVTR